MMKLHLSEIPDRSAQRGEILYCATQLRTHISVTEDALKRTRRDE